MIGVRNKLRLNTWTSSDFNYQQTPMITFAKSEKKRKKHLWPRQRTKLEPRKNREKETKRKRHERKLRLMLKFKMWTSNGLRRMKAVWLQSFFFVELEQIPLPDRATISRWDAKCQVQILMNFKLDFFPMSKNIWRNYSNEVFLSRIPRIWSRDELYYAFDSVMFKIAFTANTSKFRVNYNNDDCAHWNRFKLNFCLIRANWSIPTIDVRADHE